MKARSAGPYPPARASSVEAEYATPRETTVRPSDWLRRFPIAAPRLATERYIPVRRDEADSTHQVTAAIDTALRLGMVFLSCGAPTPDVQDAMFAAGRALGLTALDVDINFGAITISVPGQGGLPAQTTVRVVRDWHVNHTRLAAAHALTLDLSAGRLDRDEAARRLAEVERAGPGFGRSVVTLAFGVMAAAIVVSLGGGALTSAIAFGTSVAVDLAGRVLARVGAPAFFSNALGALIAALVAVALTAADAAAPSALVVAGGIMALLPGMSLVVAAQEAIGHFPVTAAARMVELMTATAGIVSGVLIGLLIAERLHVSMVAAQRFADPGHVVAAVLAGGVAAAASSVSSRGPLRMTVPAFLVGALGVAVLRGMASVSGNEIAATAAAGVAVGLAASGPARWYRVPPVLVIAPGIIPLLPGLAVYRGLLEFSQGQAGLGEADLIEAVTIAVALAAGVLLGELVTAVRPAAGRPDVS
jgi:uncharacterized membrane protein YjjP (DUF1212 family)